MSRIPAVVKELKVGEDAKGELGRREGEGRERKVFGKSTRRHLIRLKSGFLSHVCGSVTSA